MGGEREREKKTPGGFRTVMKPGDVLAIPPGYVVVSISVGATPSYALRWGILNMENRRGCHNCLMAMSDMMNCGEGLADDETWAKFKEFLEQRCVRFE